MTRPLHLQLRTLRERQDVGREEAAARVGVHRKTIGYWDRGAHSPHARHAIAYARALGHQLVVTRAGRIIGDLADLLPHVHTLREQANLSQRAMAYEAHTGPTAVYVVERHAREGTVLMSSLCWYLAVLGYAIQLMPADRLERAA